MQKIFKLLNYYLPIRDFLYILQLEEYDTIRYLKQISLRLFKRNFEQRDTLHFTTRALLLFGLVSIIIFSLGIIIYLNSLIVLITYVLLLPVIVPFLILFASLCISPAVFITRYQKLQKAKQYFKIHYKDTKIIAITGSYGKTTTKYLLRDLLMYSYDIAIIPKNINTSLGVANYILQNKLPDKCELLIIEMGAYKKGDIAEFAKMLPPDVSIITKLGDQHLERFGSFKNLVEAKYEIFSHAKLNAKKFTSAEAFTKIKEAGLPTHSISTVVIPADETDNSTLATAVAKDLFDISDTFIQDTLKKFTPPNRRNNIFIKNNVTVIDNSYNISPQTAEKTLSNARLFADSKNLRLVVFTAGIAEQGSNETEVNKEFGRQLNIYAHRVILAKNVYGPMIKKTLTIPSESFSFRAEVSDSPELYIKQDEEVLLMLPGHTDLAYF